jgi:chromosome segregation ATPase
MNPEITTSEIALAHLEAFISGGDEMGDVSTDDAIQSLDMIRAELDKQRTVSATLFENSVAKVVYDRVKDELAAALRAARQKIAALQVDSEDDLKKLLDLNTALSEARAELAALQQDNQDLGRMVHEAVCFGLDLMPGVQGAYNNWRKKREQGKVPVNTLAKIDTCAPIMTDEEWKLISATARHNINKVWGKLDNARQQIAAMESKPCARCGSMDRKIDLDFHCSTCYRNLEAELNAAKRTIQNLQEELNEINQHDD